MKAATLQHCHWAVSCYSLHTAPSEEYFFWCLIEWLWSVRSPSQWKVKQPADLCKLHLAWVCYKLGSLFSLWCQQNGGCQAVQGLGSLSYQGWGRPLYWSLVLCTWHRQRAMGYMPLHWSFYDHRQGQYLQTYFKKVCSEVSSTQKNVYFIDISCFPLVFSWNPFVKQITVVLTHLKFH